MNADLQEILALGLVAIAVIGLVVRWRLRRTDSGCSGECACPAKKRHR
jgi:hypothetical protein